MAERQPLVADRQPGDVRAGHFVTLPRATMSDRNQEAFEAVLDALRRADDPSRDELLEIATEIDPGLADLSGPEFQGRYYLPALSRLRSEAAEDVPCPFCGSGPYRGPKPLALHRRFCSGWAEEEGKPVSGDRAYRLALDRDASSAPSRAESGASAGAESDVPGPVSASERGEQGESRSAPGDGSPDHVDDAASCPYCSAAISTDGDEVRAKAIADHLRSCVDRPRWDLAETSSRPPREAVYHILHSCSRRIAERADDRDVLGATEVLVGAAEDLYRAFGHEPPMKEAGPDDLLFRQRSEEPSWLTRIRSALPFGDGSRPGEPG